MKVCIRTATVVCLLLTTASAETLADTPLIYEMADIDGICRVSFAEAGNQGPLGRLAVVEVIANRLRSGMYGGSVSAILDEKNQFEPVTRVGGSWTMLPALTSDQHKECRLLVDIVNDGGITKGATFFQNERIVADRAARGVVRKELVGFNGMPRVAEYGGHTFYRPAKRASEKPASFVQARPRRVAMMVFGGE